MNMIENQVAGNVQGTLFQVGKAKTSKVPGGKRYIPLSALEALGAIFLEGVPEYGEWNWKNGAGDKPYQMERWEHASRHLQLWAEGDRSEDHLAKVMWFCATQIELERMEQENLDELFSSTVRQVWHKEPGLVEREGVVDTLKDVGKEVGTAALLTGIEKLIALLRGRKEEKVARAQVWRVEDAPKREKIKKKKEQPRKKRVMSEEGKARIAAAQRKRWAKVRRMKKVEGKGKGK